MSRIQYFLDDPTEIILALSDGNPGAASVMAQMLSRGAAIDPDNILGSMGPILMLDTFKIYGPDIWILYKDVCGQDIVKTIAAIRSVQIGHVSLAALRNAIRGSEIFDAQKALEGVQGALPNFGKELS